MEFILGGTGVMASLCVVQPDSRRLRKEPMIQEVREIGDISGRDTPVPIPNTAVKPARANGTNAQLGVGRVGRRRSHQPLESSREN